MTKSNLQASPMPIETVRRAENSTDAAAVREAIHDKLTYSVGKNQIAATERDWFLATALFVRDQMTKRWIASIDRVYEQKRKRVYYLSLEFLVGRFLFDNITNLGMTEVVREALSELNVDFDALRNVEPDAALGNGGLGRLAACFMESAATLEVPAYGYGIRYNHGLFRQTLKDGWQREYPEDWLNSRNPWEFERAEMSYSIGFGGMVELIDASTDKPRYLWRPGEAVRAVAFDTPIVGWRGEHVNTLRLWSARAADPLRLDVFNSGDYVGAQTNQARAEAISKVLYPSESTPEGQELRLRQEYFFVAASLQDLVRRHVKYGENIRTLAEQVAIQLNDTHPAIAVIELMRIFIDLHDVEWDEAWKLTQAVFGYTNHTLLPEALESWPVPLMERLLPRHMQIIYLLNEKHLDGLRASQNASDAMLSSVSLIEEHNGRRVRMGHLAFIGSHSINGVSALHSKLVEETIFADLNKAYPGRINNKTNGITFRRWLFECNPGLTHLLAQTLGPKVMDDPLTLKQLVPFADDAVFRKKFAATRKAPKLALANLIRQSLGFHVDPSALFDVQIKRIHEYKRQLLNVLETIALYEAIRAQPNRNWTPRVKIFAGKAAASYHTAKLIIKLANDVARVVNADPMMKDRLKVAFLPNYNVSLAELIIPAADLSEQISTAGMEASGTGNMKMALNGALTIGTLDGANVEIGEQVGADNIFIFGLTTAEVAARRAKGIDAQEVIANSPMLREVLDSLRGGVFSPDDPNRYHPLVDILTYHDYFMVCADFDAYFAKQREVDARWQNPDAWWKSAVLNTANMGWFSSDRTIAEYARDIWKVPVKATLSDVSYPAINGKSP
ncbi:MAG: glycogen/starch/alpha-glucan phosphorylase [Hyphomicrobiales bacterium]|nr:glycogen/starch/alpha-glucan phosphorylase [Hyphomicrobiales bacterium]MDE2113709.1 glycogen/starch/alpha-glucan phosphorylase [Hyphomicrobiales bacterium]